MANYGEQYGQGQHQQGTDAYGNPVGQTDQYGNPIHRTGGGGYDTIAGTQAYGGSAAGTGMHGTGAHDQSQLRRSYSEDDGMGGRRKKKGIIEKIKEKLPGVGHNKEGEQPYGGGYGSAAAGGKQHHGREKKGMMEKIKEKLPGGGGGGHH